MIIVIVMTEAMSLVLQHVQIHYFFVNFNMNFYPMIIISHHLKSMMEYVIVVTEVTSMVNIIFFLLCK
jgi:hypothetical protein